MYVHQNEHHSYNRECHFYMQISVDKVGPTVYGRFWGFASFQSSEILIMHANVSFKAIYNILWYFIQRKIFYRLRKHPSSPKSVVKFVSAYRRKNWSKFSITFTTYNIHMLEYTRLISKLKESSNKCYELNDPKVPLKERGKKSHAPSFLVTTSNFIPVRHPLQIYSSPNSSTILRSHSHC